MISQTDPNGHTMTVERNSSGNPTRVTDALGHSELVEYNALGQPTKVTRADGAITSMTYDWYGNLLSQSTPLTALGSTPTVTYHYDNPAHPGDVTRVVNARGKTSRYVYDAYGSLVEQIDPAGNATTADYNALGLRTSQASPLGNVTGVDRAQYTTTYDYDARGNLTTTTDALGRSTRRGYDAKGNLISATDADGHTVAYAYDLNDRQVRIERPDATILRYEYDADGRLTSEINGANRSTTYGYDDLGNVTTVTDPLSRTTSFSYDGAGNRLTATSPGGHTTTFGYNAGDRLMAIAYSDGKTPPVAYEYDANGRRTQMIDGSGRTSYTYDSLGRTTEVVNGAGKKVTYAYDLSDNPRPNGTSAAWEHNRADETTSITEIKGADSLASFSYGRDNGGRVESITSTGLSTPSNSYVYNALDQLASDNATSYSYYSADNPTRLGSLILNYDAADQIATLVQGARTTNTSYDGRGNRLNGLSASGGTASYSFDQANRLTRVKTGTGASGANGLIAGGTSHSLAIKNDGTAWAWGANASGQLGDNTTTAAKSPVQVSSLTAVAAVAAGDSHSIALRDDGTVAAWGLNSSGQLGNGTTTLAKTPVSTTGLAGIDGVASGAASSYALRSDGTVAAWGANASGQLGNGTTTGSSTPVNVISLNGVTAIAAGSAHALALRGDGTVWSWGANGSGQLGNATTTTARTPVRAASLTGIVAIAAGGTNSYALDHSGNVWAWGDNSYGQLGNGSTTKKSLTPVQASTGGITDIAAGATHALAITSVGTLKAWGRNNSGQLGDAGACGRQYCSLPTTAGNLASGVAIAGGSVHALATNAVGAVFAWGANNSGQLGNNTTTSATSPVQIRSLAAVVPGSKPAYGYDGDGLRASASSAGITRQFAYDNSSGMPLLISDGATNYIYGPAGIPIEQIDETGTPLHYHGDQIGSTRLLTNASGAIAATYTFDAYGNTLVHTGSANAALQWQGQYLDEETGLYYLRARYYDPQTAQFLTRDPLVGVTQRPYAFAASDPINYNDPTGLFSVRDAAMFVSEAAAGALDTMSFGYSTKLAGSAFGFDATCADWGAGFGTGQASAMVAMAFNPLGAGRAAAKGAGGAAEITFGHGGRHLAGTTLTEARVNSVIGAQVQKSLSQASASGSFWGTCHGRRPDD